MTTNPTNDPISEIHDIVKNLVFSNLSIEQIGKIPKWLLVNIEDNYPTASQSISNLLIAREIESLTNILNANNQPKFVALNLRPRGVIEIRECISKLQQKLKDKEETNENTN